jgi:hypothetical protein
VAVKSAAPVVDTVTAAAVLVALPYWSTACTRTVVTKPVCTNASSALTRSECAAPAVKLTWSGTSRSGTALDPGKGECALIRQGSAVRFCTVKLTAPVASVCTSRLDVPIPLKAAGAEAVNTASQAAVRVNHCCEASGWPDWFVT